MFYIMKIDAIIWWRFSNIIFKRIASLPIFLPLQHMQSANQFFKSTITIKFTTSFPVLASSLAMKIIRQSQTLFN